MKRTIFSLFLMFAMGVTGWSATWNVNAVDFSFDPSNLHINSGDIVHFIMSSSIHDAVEVSEQTYNESGTTALSGGFSVPFGGTKDIINLSVGTHWYVCQNHASMGMKGTITVMALGVNDFQLAKSYHVFPNPANESISLKADVNLNSLDLIYNIIDINGRQISTGRLDDISSPIDISQFKSGVYFLQFGDDKRQIFKVVKR